MKRAAVFAWVVTLSSGVGAEEPVDARLSCQREPSPGRVLCELELEVPAGRLAWADALVIAAPDFARPLRSRVGPSQASAATSRRLRVPLALAATSAGRGELRVRARSVVCRPRAPSGELCTASSRVVAATVEVGVVEQRER